MITTSACSFRERRKFVKPAISWAINSSPAMIQIRQIDVVVWRPLNKGGLKPAPLSPLSAPLPSFPLALLQPPRDMAEEDGRKRFRDRRAAALV